MDKFKSGLAVDVKAAIEQMLSGKYQGVSLCNETELSGQLVIEIEGRVRTFEVRLIERYGR